RRPPCPSSVSACCRPPPPGAARSATRSPGCWWTRPSRCSPPLRCSWSPSRSTSSATPSATPSIREGTAHDPRPAARRPQPRRAPGRRRPHLRDLLSRADRPRSADVRQALLARGPRGRSRLHGLRSAVVGAAGRLPRRDRHRAHLRFGRRGRRVRRPVPGLLLPTAPERDRPGRRPPPDLLLDRDRRGRPPGAARHRRQGGMLDRVVTGVSVVAASAPAFVVGLLVVVVFALRLGLLPSGGYVPFSEDPLQWARHLVLPWATLAFLNGAIYARLVRSSMIEQLGLDYVRTARATGLSERRIDRYALRNLALPLTTLVALDIGALLGGTVITERIFGQPGLGALLLD